MQNEPEPKISITKGSDDNKRHKLLCSKCKIKTNHTTIQSVIESWASPDNDIMGHDYFLVVSCNGCETLQFCQISSNSEDFDIIDDPKLGN